MKKPAPETVAKRNAFARELLSRNARHDNVQAMRSEQACSEHPLWAKFFQNNPQFGASRTGRD